MIQPKRKHGIDGWAVFVAGRELPGSWRFSESGARAWLAAQLRKREVQP